MTPNSSGIWKDMVAVTKVEEADFFICIDGIDNIGVPQERTLFFGQHPQVGNGLSPAFRPLNDKPKALGCFPIDKHLSPGEWWIKHTYDELIELPIPKKDKDLCCVATYQTHNPMYAQRVKFLREYCNKNVLDIYGRPEEKYAADDILKNYFKGSLGHNKPNGLLGEHLVGKEILGSYKRSLEFDVGPTKNYMSERYFDALLLWTKPIYFGSTNVHEFIPKEAFDYVDIYDLSQVAQVNRILTEEIDYKAIAEARDLLLNKYQLWPYVYNKIKELT
jgi:hypothetical protein